MSGGKAKTVESLEDRQWQLKLEEIRKRETNEEREWEVLLARAKAAAQNEELRVQRARSREHAQSSGSFPRSAQGGVPPALPQQRGARRG